MKSTKVLIFCIFFLLLMSCKRSGEKDEILDKPCDSFYEIQNCMNVERPTDSYNYPVLPCMDAWRDFKSTAEMIEACQIPIGRLNEMSTDAIFQALWEYPFYYEILWRQGHHQQDFETIFVNTNTYKVFTKRTNAANVLYKRLKAVEPVMPDACRIYSRGLELFISQTVFLKQLSYKQKQDIVSISLKNDALRIKNNGGKTYAPRQITMLLLARILYATNYKPFVDTVDDKMMTFIETSLIKVHTREEYDTFIQKIIVNAQKFSSN